MRLGNFHILIIGFILFGAGVIMLHGGWVFLVSLLLMGITLGSLYSLRIAMGNTIGALFAVILFFMCVSLFKDNSQPFVTLFIVLVSLIWCGKNHVCLSITLRNDWTRLMAIERKECLTWIFLVLLIIPLGITDHQGFLSYEFHPIYEISVGRSYALSIFQAPDLSYLGKDLKIHFLSTQIPQYFSNVFYINILTSAYFLVPLWGCFLTFVLIQTWFDKFPAFKIPILYVFFTPLLSSGLFHYQGLITTTLFASLSYALGFLLISIGVYYLISENGIGLVCCATALILTKASFFLVLLGGIVLYFIRIPDFRKGFKIVSIILPLFIGLYVLFLSGAHIHNHWLLFPSIPYFALFQYGFSFSGLLFVIFPAIVLLFTAWFYLNYNGDRTLLGLASLSLSGLLGACILTESSEGNSLQFIIAAFFPMTLLVWYGISVLMVRQKKAYQIITHTLFVTGMILSVVSNVKTPIECFVMGVSTQPSEQSPSLSIDLIQAYTWMEQNTPQHQTIVFGKHYESQKSGSEWWPATGFARSAISGKQMYCENFKYKGIAMEKDFPLRFANVVHLYKNFVLGEQSQVQLKAFYAPSFGKEPGNPFSKPPRWTVNDYTKLRRKVFYYLSFGKEWSWNNRPEQVYYEMKHYLNGLDISEDWLISFLQTTGIGYIVLENGDQPSSSLKKYTQQVYQNNSITILEVKREYLAWCGLNPNLQYVITEFITRSLRHA